ncbi:PGAP1-like protein [Cylindrospermum stagnale PCC 7417]|uniref:PGAP1-like protein n=1 Tax=Cylindrospermum stagnale PCC 7417 TaxID=56107 RepID=K9WZ69_9NOST|nr:triacylglycerol lipase [Cylindrospermum stagnale]AFZ25104.1 PGAP1-like protein [Cylindrospermum stagnale PCC 7417]
MALPTVILPGYLESAIAYGQLEQSLQDLGFPTATVPLRRRDWIPTFGGRPVTPIVQQLDRTVKRILQKYNAAQINLIGHSAGGWISRIYLGEKPYLGSTWDAHPSVATLITLGTPHISQERWTRWNLDFVKNNYPGAFYKNVRYVCVAGKTIFGERRRGSWLAYSSYQLTCGQGNTWGDGITPIAAAHLDGAQNLVLEGAKHSPRSPGIWYGSPELLKAWVPYLA